MIAGHTFVDEVGGPRCSTCGRTWLYVLSQREFWAPGEPDIACRGNLNAAEVVELHAEIDRIWATVAP